MLSVNPQETARRLWGAIPLASNRDLVVAETEGVRLLMTRLGSMDLKEPALEQSDSAVSPAAEPAG